MRYIASLVFFYALIGTTTALPSNPETNQSHSCISIQSPDGSFYYGEAINGVKHGRGRYVTADGSEYDGVYANGLPHGEGTYYYPDGRRKWVSFQEGRLVESRFLGHEPDETGCVYGEFVSSGRYSGWYRGNRVKGYVPHGRGIMKYFNGSVFSGQWEDGKMHGNGSVKWEDGSAYSGQWIKGKRTGYGTYTWPNGDTYVGEWKENQICGNGIYYYNNGNIKRGTWKEKTVSTINAHKQTRTPVSQR